MADTAASIGFVNAAQRNGALASVSSVGALLAMASISINLAAATVAVALYAVIAAIVILRLAMFHPLPAFGIANLVTLVRAAMLSFMTPFVFFDALRETGGSVVFGVTIAILLLDGLDGWLARRLHTVSRFGARFDMEVDALLIMVLACVAWLAGKADVWVLMLGLMRYAFVAAGFLFPALAAELPPSLRRKLICVVQIVVLAALSLPAVAQPLSGMLAFGALMLLSWSFLVDIFWLAKARTP
ncbi:MAG: CDP-alcohol phosphatidyltransferase family protein [Rhizobiaceae bacterium]